MTQAEKALETLNGITLVQIVNTNWWDDIVRRLDGYSQELTDQFDPNGTSDIAGFDDGSKAEYDSYFHEWIA